MKKVYIIVLGLGLSIMSLIGIVYAANFYVLWATSTVIDEHSNCKYVSNTSGVGYFVPTNTSTEWSAFYNNPPSWVTAWTCWEWSSTTTVTSGSCWNTSYSTSGSAETIGSYCWLWVADNVYSTYSGCFLGCSQYWSSATCFAATGCFRENPLDWCVGIWESSTQYREYSQSCYTPAYSWAATYGDCSANCGSTWTKSRSSYYCKRSDWVSMWTTCDVYSGCECASVPASSISCTGDYCSNGYVCDFWTCVFPY
jgi:hypothetical protein